MMTTCIKYTLIFSIIAASFTVYFTQIPWREQKQQQLYPQWVSYFKHIPWSQVNRSNSNYTPDGSVESQENYNRSQLQTRSLNTSHFSLFFEMLGRLQNLPKAHPLNRRYFLQKIQEGEPRSWVVHILRNKGFYTYEELTIFKYSINCIIYYCRCVIHHIST